MTKKIKRVRYKKQELTKQAGDAAVRAIYRIHAQYVNSTYLSVLDNGDQNIQIRLTFTEDMRLNDNKVEHEPVCAVVMSIMDFQKLYNLSTLTLQQLRNNKKIP